MTVGIVFSNGLEAIVIADTQVTRGGRELVCEKIFAFSGKNYHGAVISSGIQDQSNWFAANLKNHREDDIDKFIHNIYAEYQNDSEESEKRSLNRIKKEIERAYSIIPNKDARDRLIYAKLCEFVGEFEQLKDALNTEFILPVYDKKKKRIRIFGIDKDCYETMNNIVVIGNGKDAADVYVGTSLDSISFEKLSKEDLLYFAINAHAFSTLNTGVGSTPEIVYISKDKAVKLNSEIGVICANLSGAYLSRYNKEFTAKEFKGYLKGVLDGKNEVYGKIASKLGLNALTLTTMVIPHSSWQAAANRKNFL